MFKKCLLYVGHYFRHNRQRSKKKKKKKHRPKQVTLWNFHSNGTGVGVGRQIKNQKVSEINSIFGRDIV